MGSGINVKNISLSYPHPREFHAVKGLNFDVKPKEFVSLIGPSGCGKSTTLHAIAGFLAPSEGTILIGGKQVVSPRKEVQIILQQPHLLPWKTVAENIGFYSTAKKHGANESKGVIDRYLKLIGLEEFREFYPNQLSIGMQQRVSIARALAAEPEILLMDEPFRAVDYQKRMELHEFLLNTIKKLGMTILFVTHDIEEAILLSDRILIMSRAPGSVKKEIAIDFGERSYELTTQKKFASHKKEIFKSLKHSD